jgi:flavorubredoxin
MSEVYVSEAVKYVGVDDKTIDLFESQYVVPNGVSYNSYVIMDEKIAIMDTVDRRGTDEWLANVEKVLDGRTPDYLVVQHMEPDHAGSIKILAEKYPSMQIVANAKTFPMMHNFFEMDLSGREVVVKEMDTLSLGSHTLTFVMAPMVHWPEVMVTYESSEKILFAADGFGKFGALDVEEDWACEARRYFINIVGKHGRSVQELLKKAATLDIAMICPLHGPVLKENLGYYLEKYDIWSSYRPEDKGIVVAYASIHGHTRAAVQELVQMLEEMGQKVVSFDLARCDMAEAVEDAYRYDRLIVACPTYDASIFPCMHDFLYHLQIKNFQKRTVGIIENGSWSPSAGRKMKAMLEDMRELKILEPMVTIKSSLKEETREKMRELARAMAEA